jgi:amino acid transporter
VEELVATHGGSAQSAFRLAKVAGIFTIIASALAQEYGSINFVVVNSVGHYPAVEGLAPYAVILAGLLLLPKVAIFARFSEVAPRAGSTYVWLTRSLNAPVGFSVAFVWFVGVAAAGGFLAFTCAVFIGAFLKSIGMPFQWATSSAGHLIIGLTVIWAIFGIHLAGIKHYARLVLVTFVLILVAATITVAYGFGTSQDVFLSNVVRYVPITTPPPAAPSLGAFISVTALFLFAYGGLTVSASLGGETRDATRTMPRGIILGWLGILSLYAVVGFALFHAIPWWSIPPLIAQKHLAIATTPGLIGLIAPRAVSALLNLLVAVIVIATIAPGMLETSRYIFAWAQDGLLPAHYTRTNRNQVPHVALVTIALLTSLFLVEATFGGWAIGVGLRSLSLVVVFGMLGIGVFNMRFGMARASKLAEAVAGRADMLVWASLAVVIALMLLFSIIVVPNTVWWLQPSFQGLIALSVALWIYRSASRRDGTIGTRTADLPTE